MPETNDSELNNMMNVDSNVEQENTIPNQEQEFPVESAAVAEETVETNVISTNDSVTVSEVILNNTDKHIKMTVLNDLVHTASADADVTNYIVFVNTDKKIPCLYDCDKLILPKSSVKDSNGNWNITSIEGRRSGFVIKCPGRDIIMSKNFIYDCVIENDNIISVKEYNRKHTITDVTQSVVTDFDSASLAVHSVLPKITKSGKYTTMDALKEQVRASYNSVDDINALFKIVNLRLQIGC